MTIRIVTFYKENNFTINTPANFLGKKAAKFSLVILHGFGSNSRLALNFAMQHDFKASFWHYNIRYVIMRPCGATCKAHAIQFLQYKLFTKTILFL